MLFTIEDAERAMKVHEKAVAKEAAERGYAEGHAKGRAESIKEIAIRMKEKGMSIQEIANITDLTAEEIEKIK